MPDYSVVQLGYDVQDIEATIKAVESNPARFNLTTEEVNSRKNFVRITKKNLKEMQDAVRNIKMASS